MLQPTRHLEGQDGKYSNSVTVFKDDPNEAAFSYEFRIAGIHMKGGKAIPRELTEEEKKAAEEKTKKPAAAADKKKKGEEEPSAEELERIANEVRERENLNQKRKEEWEALDDNTKFFRTCEDATKEPAVRFVSLEQRPDGALPVNQASIVLKDAMLRSLESSICDARGMWLFFDKIIPVEEEVADPKAAASKKAPAKAPAKGGTANPEDLKPTFTKGWLDLTPLMEPGVSSVTQRVFLQVHQAGTQQSKVQDMTNAKNTGMPDVKPDTASGSEGKNSPDLEDIFNQSQTYVYVTLELSEPIFPLPDSKTIRSDAKDLVKPYDNQPKFPSSSDAIDEFQSAIAFVVLQVAAEYQKANSSEESSAKNSSPLGRNSTMIYSVRQQEAAIDQRREKFLTEFTQNSKYMELRNRLKQAIFRLAVEKFKKEMGPEPLTKTERDKFKASLYLFMQKKLVDSLSDAMDRAKADGVHTDISKQYSAIEEVKSDRITASHKESKMQKY